MNRPGKVGDNLDGTVLDQKDGKGNAIQTDGYNSLAQVTSVTDALSKETDYGYDGAGNQLTKQDPSGNCARRPGAPPMPTTVPTSSPASPIATG